MLTYLIALISFIILCAFWAVFQIWLTKQDTDIASLKSSCSGCSHQHCNQNHNNEI